MSARVICWAGSRLDGESRLLELSQMLGEVGEGTLRSAHELLQVAREMIKGK